MNCHKRGCRRDARLARLPTELSITTGRTLARCPQPLSRVKPKLRIRCICLSAHGEHGQNTFIVTAWHSHTAYPTRHTTPESTAVMQRAANVTEHNVNTGTTTA